MPNRLADETSPYLLQHARQSGRLVSLGRRRRWRKAKAEDKPIFLSIGYSACHWCHVMEHESFENDAIAARAERALRADQGRSRGAARPRPDLHERGADDDRPRRLADVGVPDARPASRSSAAPTGRPTPRMGMPGFDQVLAAVTDAWHEPPRAGPRTGRPADASTRADRAGLRVAGRPAAPRTCCRRPPNDLLRGASTSDPRRLRRRAEVPPLRWTCNCCCVAGGGEPRTARCCDW